MAPTVIVVAAGAGACLSFCILASLASAKIRLAVPLVLSLPQIFVWPLALAAIPLSAAATAMSAPRVLFDSERVKRSPLVWSLVLLLLTRLTAVTWSPDRAMGIRGVLELATFILLLLVAYRATADEPDLIVNLLKKFVWIASAEAVLVIAFRVSPAFEGRFLSSAAARFLIPPGTLDGLFGASPNNVMDVDKSGGVFVNANVAAMFLGLVAFLAAGVAIHGKSRTTGIFAGLSYLAVFFTGSKSGVILALTLPTVGLVTYLWITGRKAIATSLTGLAVLASVFMIPRISRSPILVGSSESLESRDLLWRAAREAFRSGGLFGQGFGGWERWFPLFATQVGQTRVLPPHNLLIYTWSQSGVLGVLWTLLFIILVIFLLVRLTIALRGRRDKFFALCTVFAFAWVVLHALGDNTSLYGDLHTLPVLATILGYWMARNAELRDAQESQS